MINPGKYNRLIEIINLTIAKDKDDFKQYKEETIYKTYANIKTTKGYLLLKNDSDFEKALTNFTIRYPNIKITKEMKIKYNNRLYSIEYLNNVNEENIELEIQAKGIFK